MKIIFKEDDIQYITCLAAFHRQTNRTFASIRTNDYYSWMYRQIGAISIENVIILTRNWFNHQIEEKETTENHVHAKTVIIRTKIKINEAFLVTHSKHTENGFPTEVNPKRNLISHLTSAKFVIFFFFSISLLVVAVAAFIASCFRLMNGVKYVYKYV